MTQDETVMEFPCRFPIKVMGQADSAFENAVEAIINRHLPDAEDTTVSRRESNKSNYAALTITITATSRNQLDAIYMDLTACEHVIMAL